MNTLEVQNTLETALNLLKAAKNNDPIRVEFIVSLLTLFKLYSASGNEIPGCRGPALKNAIELAQTIIANNGKITKFRLDTEFTFSLKQPIIT